MKNLLIKLANSKATDQPNKKRFSEASQPSTFVPMTHEDRTYTPPGALLVDSHNVGRYGKFDRYLMTPKQAYFQAFGDRTDIAAEEYDKAMKHRLDALRWHANNPDSGLDPSYLNNFKPGDFVPVAPRFLSKRYGHHKPINFKNDGTKTAMARWSNPSNALIALVLGRQQTAGRTSALKLQQPMYFASSNVAKDFPGVVGAVSVPFVTNSEQSEAGRKLLRSIPGVKGFTTHELSHVSTDPLYRTDTKVVSDPDVDYTSERRGYGNSVAEAHGGMHQLKGWFSRHYGFVPRDWTTAMRILERGGYIKKDPADPYNSFRFTPAFDDSFTSGINTTLEDQFTNTAYAEQHRPGPWRSRINPDGTINPAKDVGYILDSQQELWDSADNRKVQQNTVFG